MRGMRNKSQSRRGAQKVVRQKMSITKGDRVRVMTGEQSGTEGTVIRVLPKRGKVVVEDVNIITKHKRGSGNEEGGILHYPAPIDVSNVMLLDPTTGEPTKVRRQKDKDGTVERLSKRSGQPIPRNR
jgi:large subunit ribosomal protein L24